MSASGGKSKPARVHTIGHSNRSGRELLALLRERAIRGLIDVRRFPASRRNPHFARVPLERALAAAAISYRHEPALGGHRRAQPGSANLAWRDEGFRGYADYMATAPFRAALLRLAEEARAHPTVILCAEADPRRCHRQLIADALLVLGIEVLHILGPGRAEPHDLHPAARVGPDGGLSYPDGEGAQLDLGLL
jgi:uncharacterized protein (DUF488 family)